MAKLKSPSSSAVVDVPDALVGTYEAGGWSAVKQAAPVLDEKPARRSRKSESE
jgi:hypothetical protein